MSIRSLALPLLGVSLLAAFSQTTSGTVIYVDFGNASGAASGLVDESPATWNVVTSQGLHSFGVLSDSAGQGTGIHLAVTDAFHGAQVGGAWNDPSIPWSVGAATNDTFYAGSGSANTAEVTLSNLDPSKVYRVSVIASRASSGGRDCKFEVNGQVADVGSASGSNPFNSYTDGYQNHRIMTWRAVAPDASNELSLLMTPLSGDNYGYLGAMRISDEQTLLFDLGSPDRTTPGNWNNITSPTSSSQMEGPGHAILGAVDAAGAETSVKVNVLAPFLSSNTNGVGAVLSGYPYEARTDSLVTGTGFEKATLQLEGLAPGDAYDITLFGSRAIVTGDEGKLRKAAYTVGGVTKELVNTDNQSETVTFFNVVANAQGHIQIDTEVAPDGYTAHAYLGVIEVVGHFASDPVGPSILVDFGSSGYRTGGHWNNLTTTSAGATLTGMVNSLGNPTKVNMETTDGFAGVNSLGELSDDAGFPETAQRDSLYVTGTNPAQIVFENLHPAAGYDLTFFGSRRTSDAPSGDLILDVTINGEKLSLDAYGNTEDVLMFKNIWADPTGTLVAKAQIV